MDSFFELALTFARIVTTAKDPAAQALLANVLGLSDGSEDEKEAERAEGQAVYQGLGVCSRPLDAAGSLGAEALVGRAADGFPVVQLRDLRVERARGDVRKGHVGSGGYGGGFFGADVATAGTGDVITLYAPYEHDGGERGKGTPAKAHLVQLDTTADAEAVVVAHGLGHALFLSKSGEAVLKSPSGGQFVSVSDDGVSVSGELAAATSFVAGNKAAAKAILVDPTESGAWFTAVMVTLGQIAAVLNQAGTVIGAPGTVTAVVAPPPVASPVAKAAPTAAP